MTLGQKMCNKFKMPTGSAGGAKEFIIMCQKVQKLIHKRCESSLMGADSGDDNDSEEVIGEDEEDLEDDWENKEMMVMMLVWRYPCLPSLHWKMSIRKIQMAPTFYRQLMRGKDRKQKMRLFLMLAWVLVHGLLADLFACKKEDFMQVDFCQSTSQDKQTAPIGGVVVLIFQSRSCVSR